MSPALHRTLPLFHPGSSVELDSSAPLVSPARPTSHHDSDDLWEILVKIFWNLSVYVGQGKCEMSLTNLYV